MHSWITSCLVLVLSLAAPDRLCAERRVALLVGNSVYDHIGVLATPGSDVRKLARVFDRLGFETILGTDLDYIRFRNLLGEFRSELKGADVGLFYYAGHGIQFQGNNYLAPTDAVFESPEEVALDAIDLNLIQNLMEENARTSLLFLDACRNNPLRRNVLSSTRGAEAPNGFAEPRSGKIGTFIAYSTAPGALAYDGTGENSPYAEALLKNLEQPEMELSQLMIAVRADVYAATGKRQRPWESTSLLEQFYFKTDEPAPVPPVQVTVLPNDPGGSGLPEIQPFGVPAGDQLASIDPDSIQGPRLGWGFAAKGPNIFTPDMEPIENGNAEYERNVLMVQENLNRIGCDAGTPDGQWGPRSQAGLDRYADTVGIDATDILLDEALLAKLEAEAGTVCMEVSSPAQTTAERKSGVAVRRKPAPQATKCLSFNGTTICN